MMPYHLELEPIIGQSGATTANEFVLLRTLVGWPAMAVRIFILIFYLRMRLDPLQFAPAGSVPPRWGTASRQDRDND